MELAKITSKGQLTLPVSLRRKFGIETGDQLLFYECDGRIILAPVTPATLADAQEAAARQHIYTLDENPENNGSDRGALSAEKAVSFWLLCEGRGF